MTLKYSASARGFFDTGLHRNIPEDAVKVSPKRHAQLFAGQAEGHEIIPDGLGRPTLRNLAPKTVAEARAACAHRIRREAARRIEQRMPLWKQINALRDRTDPGFHEIDLIRVASNLIEDQLPALASVKAVLAFPVTENPLWPEFDPPTPKD